MLYIICIQKFNCFNCLYIYIYIYIYICKEGHPLAPKILKFLLLLDVPPLSTKNFTCDFIFMSTIITYLKRLVACWKCYFNTKQYPAEAKISGSVYYYIDVISFPYLPKIMYPLVSPSCQICIPFN